MSPRSKGTSSRGGPSVTSRAEPGEKRERCAARPAWRPGLLTRTQRATERPGFQIPPRLREAWMKRHKLMGWRALSFGANRPTTCQASSRVRWSREFHNSPTHARMHKHTHTSTKSHVHTHTRTSSHTCAHTHMHAHTHTNMYTHTMHEYMHTHRHMHTHVCTHTHSHTHPCKQLRAVDSEC